MRLQKHQLAALTAHEKMGLPMEGFVMPPPLPRKKRSNEEWRIQSDFFSWARGYLRDQGIPSCLLFHVPNGSMLGGFKTDRQIRGKMLKLAGLTNGVVDVIFLYPRPGYPALLIEFKTPEGVLSDDQIVFRAATVAQGFKHETCHSAEDGRRVLEEYLPQ